MQIEKIFKRLAVVVASALAIVGLSAATGNAAVVPISIAKANNFGLIVGGGLTNTGQSMISGDLALTPVISYTDTGLLTLQGAYHFGDAAAIAAQADAATAYSLASTENPSVVVVSELAGQTLLPGIYTNVAGISVNGTVNLDAQNNPNAIFVLQTPLALTTGPASHVNLLNGAQACNIFWQVGTTSTLGAGSDFKGNILGKGNFVSAAGSIILGRVLITQGSASLNATQITRPKCNSVEPTPTVNLGEGGGSYVSQYGMRVLISMSREQILAMEHSQMLVDAFYGTSKKVGSSLDYQLRIHMQVVPERLLELEHFRTSLRLKKLENVGYQQQPESLISP